jgi:flagellar biogenesis protein FliO|tara:strand:+ start:174 stop:458 length:285 start_codon:yes stop_codon:yes gene_type:complete
MAPEIDVIRWLSAVTLLGGLFYAFYFLAKKKGYGGLGQNGAKVVARTILTRDASLVTVEIEGQRLLLGIGKESVNLITHLNPNEHTSHLGSESK